MIHTKLIDVGATVSSSILVVPALAEIFPSASLVHTEIVFTPSPEESVKLLGLDPTHPASFDPGLIGFSETNHPVTHTLSVSLVILRVRVVELV